MSMLMRDVPFGVRMLQGISTCCLPRLHFRREYCFQTSVLVLTYIAYMCYHLSRKPLSVVKTVLHRNCSAVLDGNNDTWCDWAPFDGSDTSASQLLGTLDSAFLFAYAIAMFFSGLVAERVNLRFFLSLGMLFSGLSCYLFGIAKELNVHYFSYFIMVQIFGGIVQTTGWPGVVAVVGKWFGKEKRGLIFGIWNSHTSIGNILGSVIAGRYAESDWSMSFIVPALIIGAGGTLIFLFLVADPEDVNIPSPNRRTPRRERYRKLQDHVANNQQDSYYQAVVAKPEDSDSDDTTNHLTDEHQRNTRHRVLDDDQRNRLQDARSHLLADQRNQQLGGDGSGEEMAIGFLGACRIPGVLEYSLSLFFSKLVSYTFLYWLPLYLSATTAMSAEFSADTSTLFDIGGIIGAIAAGLISDYTGMSAATCVIMLLIAGPMMFIYQHFCTFSLAVNMVLLLMVGILVNGPYALITTAVSTELGTHASLRGSSKALATVTAIIDGTGSIGAAVGPLLAGFLSSYGWHHVFYMLIVSDILALVLLLRLLKQEVSKYNETNRQDRIE